MPLPKAVQEAKDKVAEIRKEQGLATEGTQEEIKTLPAPIEKGDKPTGEKEPIIIQDLPREALPVDEGTVVEPGKKTPVADHTQEYKVLQGKYDKEVPRLNDQIRTSEDALANAQATIANLNDLVLNLSKPDDGATAGPEAGGIAGEKKTVGKLELDQFTGYGEEMSDVINTVNSVIAENDALRVTIAELKLSVANMTNKTEDVFKSHQVDASNKFYSAIEEVIPNWEAINGEQWWKEWLGEMDPLSGIRRQDLLNSAQKAGESERVIMLFRQGMADSGYKDNGGKKRQIRGDLEDQLVPERGAGSGGALPDSFEQVTDEQLNKATFDKKNGKISMDQYKDIAARFIKTNQQLQGV